MTRVISEFPRGRKFRDVTIQPNPIRNNLRIKVKLNSQYILILKRDVINSIRDIIFKTRPNIGMYIVRIVK